MHTPVSHPLRDADRYLSLVAWAERRYANGQTLSGRRVGAAPVRWIELRAAERYLASPAAAPELRWQ